VNVPFKWLEDQQRAFVEMIMRFTTSPIHRYFDHSTGVIIDTDASDYVSAGVHSQRDNDGILHLVAHFSKTFTSAQCNDNISDNEPMAMIKPLEEWRSECEWAELKLQLITAQKNLEYFMSKKLLNRQQARWAELLSRFKYQIIYRPGNSHETEDALTRRRGDLPGGGDS